MNVASKFHSQASQASSSQVIMSVTGHRNVTSLATHIKRNKDKREASVGQPVQLCTSEEYNSQNTTSSHCSLLNHQITNTKLLIRPHIHTVHHPNRHKCPRKHCFAHVHWCCLKQHDNTKRHCERLSETVHVLTQCFLPQVRWSIINVCKV